MINSTETMTDAWRARNFSHNSRPYVMCYPESTEIRSPLPKELTVPHRSIHGHLQLLMDGVSMAMFDDYSFQKIMSVGSDMYMWTCYNEYLALPFTRIAHALITAHR